MNENISESCQFGLLRAPRSILFGCGQRGALGDIVALIGSRALICTDQRFAASEPMKAILANLAEKSIAVHVFDQTLAELPSDSIIECVAGTRDFNPDVVIGVGGGSCMDMAKLVALLLTHGDQLDRYYGEFKVPGPVLPVIAMPTTSGTGSEVTPVAVLADSRRDLKVGVSSPYLIPHTAICDPELTVSCPPLLTALSGADALTHAIEAFTAVSRPAYPELSQQKVFVGRNVFSDQFALEAIRIIFKFLPEAVEDGTNLLARTKIMYASLCAGLAFGAAGTAVAHAIQYPVGALTHTPHGLGVAALLPYVMSFNAPARVGELAQIASTIGVQADTRHALAEQAILRTRALCECIGIPKTLAELGLSVEKLDWVADQSMLATRLIDNNPVKLTRETIRTLIQNAYVGVHKALA